MYLSPNALINIVGASEVARLLAGRYDLPGLSAELLTAVIDNSDLSVFEPEEVAIAQEAAEKVALHCTNATRVINDALRSRYVLPIDSAVVDESGLPEIAQSFVMNSLEWEPPEHIVSAYKEANKRLEKYGNGKLSLGGAELIGSNSGGSENVSATHVIKTAKPRSNYNWAGY
jgi:phage gp36-like protein